MSENGQKRNYSDSMYLDFYQLKENPFPISSDLKFFFPSSGHQKALKVLAREISQRNSLLTVLGDFGLGKTILIQKFLKENSRDDAKIISLLNSNITSAELLLFLCRELGLPLATEGQSRLWYRLLRGLDRVYESGIGVVLLIDEAHNMPWETLESLRLLSDRGASSKRTIQVVFVGQPAFWEKLNHRDLRQLKQRIGVVIQLPPLTPAESLGYIRFRIEKAGGQFKAVFTRGALSEMVREAAGNPLKINILGNNALIGGYERSQKPVSAKTVKEVIRGSRRAGRINYLPWALSSAGILLVSLGWTALHRFPDFSRHRIVTGKVIEEQFIPAVPSPVPPKEKKAGSFPSPPVSRDSINEKVPSLPPISSEMEIPNPAPRSEDNPLPLKQNSLTSGVDLNREADLPSVLQTPSVRTVRIVRKGDNFFRLVLEVYGFSNQAVWELVRKHNPRINDVTKIQVGEKIVFPEWGEGGEKNG